MDEKDDAESACPICFESFEETGDHNPRILPCGGIICEKCVEELIADGAIECPECGSDHPAENGCQSFPERVSGQGDSSTETPNEPPPLAPQQDTPQEKDIEDESRCKEHGIHPSIYCKEPYCQKAILLLQTQEEDVVDAEDEQFDTLFFQDSNP